MATSEKDTPDTSAVDGRRCGFVTILGPTNAGKSTLINALVGTKVAIVSHKVQTTRAPIRGIAIEGQSQIVFLDTAGIFSPKRRLDRAMVDAAWSGLEDADAVLLVIDAAVGPALPAALPALLVFPILGIADARLGFDIVEPCVFHPFAAGPDVLAGNAAGMAPDALVEIQHHRDLSTNFHSAASRPDVVAASGSSSQSILAILRTITNSSRFEPTVP